MSRIAAVDGQFVAHRKATVAMEDRGYQFADGIYEVVTLFDGRLVGEELHLNRMERSLKEMGIPMPLSRRALMLRIRELIRRNRKRSGLVYMQVTRGVGMRNHIYKGTLTPVFTMAFMPAKFPTQKEVEEGVSVITSKDLRWARCDIKSIGLLPNVMSRMEAHKAGVKEAWLINDAGVVTEGSLSNAYIIEADGTLRTHPADHSILNGVRRETILQLAKEAGIKVREEAFTMKDVAKASEACLSSASTFVLPITKIDGKPIGNGKVGPVVQRLMELYFDHVMEVEPIL